MEDAKRYDFPDWVANKDPIWRRLVLPRLPAIGVRWLEIGSLEGRSACWVLDNALDDDGELVCVDIWPGKRIEANFDYNVAGRATKIKGRSADFLRDDDSIYDVVHIDGSHDAPDVLEDAVLSWPRLKPGGVLIFDDYPLEIDGSDADKVNPGPAIDGFLSSFAKRLCVLHKEWQVIAVKTR